MGALLLLADAEPGDGAEVVEFNAAVVEAWAELGITSVTVLRDGRATAFVLEGWAFDVDRLGERAARVVAPPNAVRVLRPVLASAISALQRETREG